MVQSMFCNMVLTIRGVFALTTMKFQIYKIPDGKPPNNFAFNADAKNAVFAKNIVNETHKFWKGLISKEIPSDKISL